MYRLVLAIVLLVAAGTNAYGAGPAADAGGGDGLSGRYESLGIEFYARAGADGEAVAEIAINGKTFLLRLSQGRLRALSITAPGMDGTPVKSAADTAALAAFHARLAADYGDADGDARLLLLFSRYLVGFFPEDEPFEGIVVDAAATPQAAVPICDSRGELLTGEYSPYLNPFDMVTETAIVGDPLTDCLGRCGVGCLQFFGQTPAISSNYTQACFNHDLCAGFTGDTLGNCTDEFLLATDDYISEIGCPAKITGRWDVTGYLNDETAPAIRRATVIFRDDGTLSVVGGGAGTWSKVLNYFEFHYQGLAYYAFVNATDLVLQGRIDNAGGTAGYWSGLHLTTDTAAP